MISESSILHLRGSPIPLLFWEVPKWLLCLCGLPLLSSRGLRRFTVLAHDVDVLNRRVLALDSVLHFDTDLSPQIQKNLK